MKKIATKRLRAPVAQSQACVFSVSSGVFALVKGHMRCVNLRFNAQRTVLSNNGPNNPARPGILGLGANGWLYFRYIGRTSPASFNNSGIITLIDPSVKIREKMNTWQFQSDNSIGSLSNVIEVVIARF